MTTIFYAQPYNIEAEGFYFRSIEDHRESAKNHKNSYGELVE